MLGAKDTSTVTSRLCNLPMETQIRYPRRSPCLELCLGNLDPLLPIPSAKAITPIESNGWELYKAKGMRLTLQDMIESICL
jgi:hypothetical protein